MMQQNESATLIDPVELEWRSLEESVATSTSISTDTCTNLLAHSLAALAELACLCRLGSSCGELGCLRSSYKVKLKSNVSFFKFFINKKLPAAFPPFLAAAKAAAAPPLAPFLPPFLKPPAAAAAPNAFLPPLAPAKKSYF